MPRISERRAERCAGLALAFASLWSTGCAVRLAGSEHYIGPVLFRYAEPPTHRAHVSQVRSVGLLGELGGQWGVTVGVVDRVAVAPATGSCASGAGSAGTWRWERFGLPGLVLEPGTWLVSPFYLRGVGIPEPCFIRRALYGATATAGSELNAFSVGVTTRTHTRPPRDAVTVLHFDESRPLDTRFSVWPADRSAGLPISPILKEISE